MVLTCFALMISYVEQLSMYFLAIYYIVFGNTSVQDFYSLACFIFFLILSCMSCLYILDINL